MMANKLHPSQHRKSVNDLSPAQRQQLRNLIVTDMATQNPVGEHLAAATNPSLHIHGHGFLAWHTVFIAKLEQWLVLNGGGNLVPLLHWDSDTPIPAELNRGNHNPNPAIPFPDSLRPGPIANIASYEALNNKVVPYHNSVPDNMGGQKPFPLSSPSDPIVYPFSCSQSTSTGETIEIQQTRLKTSSSGRRCR